ncbi:MAG: PTS lactose/cellobiose transporter subunit IIA [Paraclostridium sp.]|uniref:PTS lactose/cellobiose transporter subunit IIA n=1 Tax=Paraclostridium sp. TaxID=2023273 RepID=UPI003F32088F
MNERIFEISFGIIGHAGDAKSSAHEALAEAKEGNFEKARELLKEAGETLNKAHRFQTELIQAEASGEKTEMGVVLVHSQDHLMTTMNFLQLAKEFVDMYEFIYSKLG